MKKKRGLVIRRIKAKSGADAVAKAFGEDKEFRTRVIPNKKKDHTKPSWEDMHATRKGKTTEEAT